MPEAIDITVDGKRTRSRAYQTHDFEIKSKVYLDFGGGSTYVIEDTTTEYKTSGTQITESEGHPFPPSKGSLQDVGGDFFTQKQYVSKAANSRKKYTSRRGIIAADHEGPILAACPPGISGGVSYPPAYASTRQELEQYGATAISRCKPDNSPAQASTFLGELVKDGLPSLPGIATWAERALTAKNAANEYLNVQFGWRPLLNDISSLTNTFSHADAVLTQYERDAGKVVRRKYGFPTRREIIETSSFGGASPWGPTNSEFGRNTNDPFVQNKRREILQDRWFSGAFTYYLPSGYASRNAMGEAALLADRIGLSIGPELLWNLAPWSWAVDWFSNAGDVISNVESFIQDGQVMRYGYIMEHTIVTDTYTTGPYTTLGGLKIQPKPLVLVTETKMRVKATPYGFGVHLDGLSAFQTSILAALGISRH